MRIDVDKLPKFNDRNGTQKVFNDLTLTDLKDSGVAFGNYGLSVGDVIEFPPETEFQAKAQHTQRNNPNSPKAYYVAVLRNDNPSWLSLGSLRRRDKDMEYCCDWSRKYANELGNDDAERIQKLFGKRIKCTGVQKREVNKFKDGERTAETEEKSFPVIEFVD